MKLTSLLNGYLVALACGTVVSAQTAPDTVALSGRVQNVCGQVLPGTTVTLQRPASPPIVVVTDGAGRYAFTSVPKSEEPWTLTAQLVGHTSERWDDLHLQSGTPTTVDMRLEFDHVHKESVTVSDGDPTARYDVFLLYGVVASPDGRPIEGARVELRLGSNSTPAVRIYTPFETCATDPRGRFEIHATTMSPVTAALPLWTVSAEVPGKPTSLRANFALPAGEPTCVDLIVDGVQR